MPLFFLLLGFIFSRSMVSLPSEKKLELLQMEQYKRNNIVTVEEFDKHFGAISKGIINPIFIIRTVILVIFVFGLWIFKGWGRLGMILYSIFNIAENIWLHLSLIISSNPIPIGRSLSLIVSGFVIYYLTRPKVKEMFR